MKCRAAQNIVRRFREGIRTEYVRRKVFKASAHVDTCRCDGCHTCSVEADREPQPKPEVLDFPRGRMPTVPSFETARSR